MKKFAVVLSVAALFGSVALASSIAVPFFKDNAADDMTSGTASFIGIHNNTDEDIVVAVKYMKDDGTDYTPANNTFLLPALSSVSWRPHGDSGAEGPLGQSIGNMTSTDTAAGGAVIMWEGAATDIQGRMVQMDITSGDSHAYLLPQGV
jgi:hypothetical protein